MQMLILSGGPPIWISYVMWSPGNGHDMIFR
jgi:hypothetical protein